MYFFFLFIKIIGFSSLVYFLLLNGTYIAFTVIAWSEVRRQRLQRLYSGGFSQLRRSPLTPGISILVPAYNEQASIVSSVRSLLALNYPRHEIIVVSDGSTDKTLESLIKAYDLVSARIVLSDNLEFAPIRGTYLSRKYPNLVVIDKENGGKADSLNAACACARYPFICAIDADAVLEEDALIEVSSALIENPEQVIASGGIVRIANGCTIEDGRVTDVKLPKNLLASLQAAEYLRAFLVGRIGWSKLRSLIIISGAFGMFNRQLVEEVGGWSVNTVGEDTELVVRLHKRMIDLDQPYKVEFVPDPVCWTEAPEDWRSLASQRRRWQRGMLQTLSLHRKMIFNPSYKQPGLLGLPYFVIFEMFGPFLEIAGYIIAPLTVWFGILPLSFLEAFLIASLVLGTIISFASLAIEEFGFRRHSYSKDMVRLIGVSLLENFGYRQANTVIRILATADWILKKEGWGQIKRIGFDSTEKDSPQT